MAAIPAASGVSDPAKIRVAIVVNDKIVHVPLPEILKAVSAALADLEERVTALETP